MNQNQLQGLEGTHEGEGPWGVCIIRFMENLPLFSINFCSSHSVSRLQRWENSGRYSRKETIAVQPEKCCDGEAWVPGKDFWNKWYLSCDLGHGKVETEKYGKHIWGRRKQGSEVRRRQSFGWSRKEQLCCFARQRRTHWAPAFENYVSQPRRMW